MIHNVNWLMIDINGELFPAVNICVPDCYPEFEAIPDFNDCYGVYFEMLFESGYNATVYQEVSWDLCNKPLEHFTVEIYHKEDNYHQIIFAYHCDSEDELAQILNQEKTLNAIRDELAIDKSALADI